MPPDLPDVSMEIKNIRQNPKSEMQRKRRKQRILWVLSRNPTVIFFQVDKRPLSVTTPKTSASSATSAFQVLVLISFAANCFRPAQPARPPRLKDARRHNDVLRRPP